MTKGLADSSRTPASSSIISHAPNRIENCRNSELHLNLNVKTLSTSSVSKISQYCVAIRTLYLSVNADPDCLCLDRTHQRTSSSFASYHIIKQTHNQLPGTLTPDYLFPISSLLICLSKVVFVGLAWRTKIIKAHE